jgi:hypothetical protein
MGLRYDGGRRFPPLPFANVADNFPEQVDSISTWQMPIKKYNITSREAAVLSGFVRILGSNFQGGRVCAVAVDSSGAAAIPLELAQTGFPNAGFGDPELNYQQEVRVFAGGFWTDGFLELGRLKEKFNGKSETASAKVAGIMDILTGEWGPGGDLSGITQADFLMQIEDVAYAADRACQNILSKFRV